MLPTKPYGEVRAELRDTMLSFDREAYEAADAEADAEARTYHRLRALWLQAKEAREADYIERIPETAAAIKYVAQTDFLRREQKS